MGQFKFQVLEMKCSTPQEWLRRWSKRYDEEESKKYVEEYKYLIAHYKSYCADDFRRIGKWKDSVTTMDRWKQDVASVAYLIWEHSAATLPTCPDDAGTAAFLDQWANLTYTDTFKAGPRKKRFGLSRATTLLHFLSGGLYPIFDSRVKTGLARLCGGRELEDDVSTYLTSCVPLVRQLARQCGTDDIRLIDKALFSYGAMDKRAFISAD